ncbi:MAG: cytochrome c oxidase accessory protein CcoG [Methylophilaceae bacterium]
MKTNHAALAESTISLYEAQIKIYPRSISGSLAKWRWLMVWLTQLFFYGVPWLEWGQRQALLFDLESKRFFIFGLVLYPQDLIYLTVLLIISALSLFLFTTVAGRLWCGYTCPQTVYTQIFLWIEAKVEGDRAARMKLDGSEVCSNKITKKTIKHIVWILFALWTGFTFVGYFTPIRELMHDMMHFSAGPWNTFWVMFYGFATYGNAGFMREQVCKYMCPYARFQSVMFDNDTMIVAYNEQRGEPRGARSKKAELNNLKDKKLGSCIDCTMCVQVCPTGIDIRDGLQYMCIGCGACVDACDSIMDKMNYPRGLIKYATQNGLSQNWSRQQMLKHILRPRVLIYSVLLILLCVGMGVSLYNRSGFRVDVMRDRGVMARLEGDKLENVYRLQIMNATESLQRYEIRASGLPELETEVESGSDESHSNVVSVKSAEALNIAVDLKVPDGKVAAGSHKIVFEIKALSSNSTETEKSVFLVPKY